jgi:Leucine-rich repeat (LRR) protein
VKEPWEDGLSAGVLRLRRAQEAEAAAAAELASEKPNNSSHLSLENSKYYTANTLTLTLPASSVVAVKGAAHARSFSVASSVLSSNPPSDLGIPIPVLPLAFIATQSISRTLKVLELNNRRMDQSFSLPPRSSEVALHNLEELSLQGCSLGDTVPTTYGDEPRTIEPLLPLISKLFPTLLSLDLTYNSITSSSLNIEALFDLMLTKAKPLRHLRLRGNRITDLSGFEALAEHFKGNREVPTWKLEELDLRDNEIGKLPAELGLLPLDVFLVDGNTFVSSFLFERENDHDLFSPRFRVPPRRIWEREGTKGLLSWLRGRLE